MQTFHQFVRALSRVPPERRGDYDLGGFAWDFVQDAMAPPVSRLADDLDRLEDTLRCRFDACDEAMEGARDAHLEWRFRRAMGAGPVTADHASRPGGEKAHPDQRPVGAERRGPTLGPTEGG